MPITLGSSHFATQTWEIQRTNNFEIQISGLDDLVGAGSARLITLAVESGFLPSEQSNVVELNYSNTVSKVAGTTTYSSGNLVVKDAIQEDIEKIIRTWRKHVYDPTGDVLGTKDAVGLAFNYKKDARVIQYAPDGTLERTWILQGVWPSSVDYGPLDYTSAGAKKTITMTIEYDKAIREEDSELA